MAEWKGKETGMTEWNAERSQRVFARIAGAMYLAVIALFLLGMLIGSQVTGGGDLAETARRIAAHETTYRMGLCVGLLGVLATTWLAGALYATVKPVDPNLAMVALLARVPELVGSGVVLGLVSLKLRLDANSAGAFDANQLRALLDLNSAANGGVFNFSAISFSMGSTIFFYLFLKSGYIPRILSVWGMFASLVVAALGFTDLIAPQYAGIAGFGWAPMFLAEVATGLWLLVKGIRTAA